MNTEDNKFRILVSAEAVDGRFNIEVGLFPNQRKLTVSETVHTLTSAVALLIKSSGKYETGVKEHELMQEVIEHLTGEFISNESFSDLLVKDGKSKKNSDKKD